MKSHRSEKKTLKWIGRKSQQTKLPSYTLISHSLATHTKHTQILPVFLVSFFPQQSTTNWISFFVRQSYDYQADGVFFFCFGFWILTSILRADGLLFDDFSLVDTLFYLSSFCMPFFSMKKLRRVTLQQIHSWLNSLLHGFYFWFIGVGSRQRAPPERKPFQFILYANK